MKLKQHFKIKQLDETGSFSGIAWVYGEADRHGEEIQRGAFTKSLERIAANGGTLPLLWSHDENQVIGSIDSFNDTEHGLEVTGQLELSIGKAEEAHKLMQIGALFFSVGFAYDASTVETQGNARIYTAVDLYEISVVSTPANAGAVITSVKSFNDCNNVRDFESLVRDVLGLSRRQAKRLASVGYPVLTECDAQDIADEQQIISALKSATKQLKNFFKGM